MQFVFYSPVSFEPWDFRTPDTTGIGGSETHVAEVARRIAERGHEVTVYAPLAPDCPEKDAGGARWLPLAEADFTLDALWVMCRCPQDVDKLHGQRAWVVCQDVEYAQFSGFTPERVAKMEKIIALCPTHQRYYQRRYPHMGDKCVVSSNGIKVDLIREIENGLDRRGIAKGNNSIALHGLQEDWGATAAMPDSRAAVPLPLPEMRTGDIHRSLRSTQEVVRDHFKIIYTSSPDRGLIPLLNIFRRAREFEPRLTLSVAYGLDNINKCEGPQWRAIEKEVDRLLHQPGVTWLGRIGQRALYREFLSAGMWVYCTNFQETSCVTCMEAQALGAVPICSPVWALEDNVRHGIFVQGSADDPMTRSRFVRAVLNLAWNHELQEKIRAEMMPWAREKFNWERVVDAWEGMASGIKDCASWYAQYAFQLRHAKGRVLNVGCNCDMPGFGKRGGVNVDLHAVDPYTKQPNKAHVVADCRQSLPVDGEFDTVILGDILEHMTDADAVASLRNARDKLRGGGRVLVTVPEDHRHEACPVEYASDIPGGHPRPITRDVLYGWLADAGLRAEEEQSIDYGQFTGRGVVAV